jgi:hypothetical protein
MSLVAFFSKGHGLVDVGGGLVENMTSKLPMNGIAVCPNQIGVVGSGVEIKEDTREDVVERVNGSTLSDSVQKVVGAFSFGSVFESVSKCSCHGLIRGILISFSVLAHPGKSIAC